MYSRPILLFLCVLVMVTALTWVFLGMRAVMDIGGTCATGGPYQIASPCPDHIGLFMGLGIPVMVISALIGSALAVVCGAPNLILPMWGLLFGSLGWNFLEYGLFNGDVVWGWVICGVVFWAMALPAVLVLFPWGRIVPAKFNPRPENNRAGWLLAYLALGIAGAILGLVTFAAIS